MRRPAYIALLAIASVWVACESGNPFLSVIDTPAVNAEAQYSVEASIYPDDTSRVFITLTTPEDAPVDPAFQRATSVEVRVGQAPPARFREVIRERSYNQELERELPLVFYEYRFRENQLAPGDTVRLRVELPDGATLSSRAVVPRAASSVGANIEWTREYVGNVAVGFSHPDSVGPDAYLLRASAVGYTPARDADGRELPDSTAAQRGEVSFYLERGLSFNYYGARFLVDDRAFDGSTGVHLFSGDLITGSRIPDSTRVRFALSTINPTGYQYLRGAQRAYDQSDNILVEPSTLPSNIEGGVGALIVSSPAVYDEVLMEAEY